MTAPAPAPIGTAPPDAEDTVDRTDWLSSVPFFGAHLVPLAAFFVVVTWEDWLLCGLLYVVRMFFITAGYHRYLSHRSFRTGRLVQFVLAAGGTTALQKGPLWWASHHRLHHRFTDLDQDVHSPRDGFWWSHVGWILSTRYKRTDLADIKDFAAFPELRFLERAWWLGPLVLAAGCYLVGGWGGLVIGFFLSTVLLWHATFLVNSAAHLIGRRRFATPDTSRNSAVIAFITGGEGWHNNHHYLPASARQGFTRWEIDPTWYLLRALARLLHLVRELKRPAGPAARPGPGPRRRLRHRHVPLLLGARRPGHRGAHRRPQRPTAGPLARSPTARPTTRLRWHHPARRRSAIPW
jgi:stearoyl-CoA desaturase (delta-9 desaturase)